MTADGVAVNVPALARPDLWADWFGRLTATAPGCYAVQMDGTSFTSVAVLEVRRGPIPPG